MLFSSCFLSCENKIKINECIRTEVNISENVPLNKDEAMHVFGKISGKYENPSCDDLLEITVIYFSHGKETFSYDGDDKKEIQPVVAKGAIEVLIKVRIDNELKEAVVLRGSGNDRKQILDDVSVKIKNVLGL